MMARSARWPGALLASLVLLAPAPGRSQPVSEPRAALARRLSVARSPAASDCPDTAQLLDAVEPLLHGPRSLDVHIDVQLARSAAGYEARLRVSGQRVGERAIDDVGPTCAALADALAVTVAMVLEGRDEAPPTPTPPASAPPRPRPTRGRPPELSLRLAAETTAGLTALGATGPAAEVAVRLGPWLALGLGGSYLPPSSYALDPGRVDVSLLTARLRGCALLDRGSLHIGPCVLTSVGRMSGDGHGFERDLRPARLWVASGVGLTAGSTIAGRLGWLVEAGALVPWERKSFSVDRLGDGPVFEEAPVAGFVRFGLEAKIF